MGIMGRALKDNIHVFGLGSGLGHHRCVWTHIEEEEQVQEQGQGQK